MLKYSRKIYIQFPPSEPCSCNVCRNYCFRPGWWLVCEAREAIEQGYANRMMLEFSPDLSFGVLSPAFKNNEANFALKTFSKNGCTFLLIKNVRFLVNRSNHWNVGSVIIHDLD